MKQWLYLVTSVLVLSSCWGESSSSSSIFSFSEFDYFSREENGKTIRRQYVIHRHFSVNENGKFDGVLLNPLNYPEDETIQPYYRTTANEPGDFSNETLTFASQNDVLRDYLNNYSNQRFSVQETSDLLEIMDQNDEMINTQSIFYFDRNVSEDLDNGSYYVFNNFFRQETSVVKRYDDFVLNGEGSGNILYQDGFEVDFTFQTQIYANESTIYQLRDETFPEGIRTAKDSKATSLRDHGNFKQALTIGGGGQAKRFIDTYSQLYQLTGGVLDPNQYAYTLRAEKTMDHTKVTFYIYRPIAGLFQTQTLQDMTLTYEVYIRDGIVSDIVARQTIFHG